MLKLLIALAAILVLAKICKGIKWLVLGIIEERKAKKAWRGPYWGKKPPSKPTLKSQSM